MHRLAAARRPRAVEGDAAREQQTGQPLRPLELTLPRRAPRPHRGGRRGGSVRRAHATSKNSVTRRAPRNVAAWVAEKYTVRGRPEAQSPTTRRTRQNSASPIGSTAQRRPAPRHRSAAPAWASSTAERASACASSCRPGLRSGVPLRPSALAAPRSPAKHSSQARCMESSGRSVSSPRSSKRARVGAIKPRARLLEVTGVNGEKAGHRASASASIAAIRHRDPLARAPARGTFSSTPSPSRKSATSFSRSSAVESRVGSEARSACATAASACGRGGLVVERDGERHQREIQLHGHPQIGTVSGHVGGGVQEGDRLAVALLAEPDEREQAKRGRPEGLARWRPRSRPTTASPRG